MKKYIVLLFIFLIVFKAFTQNAIEDFKNEMDEILSEYSKASWDYNLRIRDSKIYSSLNITLPSDIDSNQTINLNTKIEGIIDQYFSEMEMSVILGREIKYREIIEPINEKLLESSGNDYFNLETFLIRSGFISSSDFNKFGLRSSWSYYRESPSSETVLGIDRTILIDAIYFNLDEFEEIKNLIESSKNIIWLE